jgi:hypothetical protein
MSKVTPGYFTRQSRIAQSSVEDLALDQRREIQNFRRSHHFFREHAAGGAAATTIERDRIFKRPFLWPELYRSPGRVVNSCSALMKNPLL